MAEERVRAHAVVTGRVQGVFFRQSTAEEARAAGAAGWVRNLPGGEVEAVFEGSRPAVERALAFVATGPPHAYVESVDTSWEEPRGESDFKIL